MIVNNNIFVSDVYNIDGNKSIPGIKLTNVIDNNKKVVFLSGIKFLLSLKISVKKIITIKIKKLKKLSLNFKMVSLKLIK